MVEIDVYDRACRKIEESDEAEHDLFKADLRAHGILLCRFDDLPCNMIFSSIDAFVCRASCVNGSAGNVWYCDRIRFKGGQGWNLSIREKVERQGLLNICRGKRSDLCFFDKKVCGSGISNSSFPNGCASHLTFGRDRSGGVDSSWCCGRIQFEGGMSLAEKVRRQGVLKNHKESDVE